MMIAIETERQAIDYAKNQTHGAGVAISFNGPQVVFRKDAEALEARGVQFAYLTTCPMADGSERIVAVPVN